MFEVIWNLFLGVWRLNKFVSIIPWYQTGHMNLKVSNLNIKTVRTNPKLFFKKWQLLKVFPILVQISNLNFAQPEFVISLNTVPKDRSDIHNVEPDKDVAVPVKYQLY